MLEALCIRNFAIIDDLQITFQDGLTVLSGETGAGKSIIISAVNLLLGSRASGRLIRSGADCAELEALFRVPPGGAPAAMLAAADCADGDALVVRRLISRNERHRAYLNHRLSTMQALASATASLASISGQHAHQGLLNEDRHLLILDRFGGLLGLREALGACYRALLPLIQELKTLHARKDRQTERLELLRFQLKEILDADIQPAEDERLAQEQLRLRSAETLFRTAQESIDGLYAAQGAVVERLAEIQKSLEKASGLDAELAPVARRLAETGYQLEDVVDELRRYRDTVSMDERRLEMVEARLDLLRGLKRKYGGSLALVAERRAAIEEELAQIGNLDARMAAVRQQIVAQHARLADQCRRLSTQRQNSARRLGRKVESELASLNMAQTRFEVLLQPLPADPQTDPFLTVEGFAVGETGFDRACFMIAPNVGEELKPLAAIASGGELSRVVLALKAILAQSDAVATIIFDEVDAGIGGGVAEMVGQKLAALARHHQVLCITHLPQIARFADHHYRISKHVAGGRTHTRIAPLTAEERVQEIARMLGGATITAKTLAHAREMLDGRL
jgi:DNA repair protein RecN (Recombination protein N)